jgi:hypothetical protein
MADNLSVSVTADTSDLRAQLALAQADLRAFGAETRTLANSIRSGSDASGVLRGQLEQVAGQFNRAKGEVTGLTAALRDHKAANDNAATGLKGISQAIEGAVAPVAGLVGGLGGIAAALGAAFVAEMVNRVIEFARSMAELGETTIKLAAATGQTPEEFSSMSAAMAIAGAVIAALSKIMKIPGPDVIADKGEFTRAMIDELSGYSAVVLKAAGREAWRTHEWFPAIAVMVKLCDAQAARLHDDLRAIDKMEAQHRELQQREEQRQLREAENQRWLLDVQALLAAVGDAPSLADIDLVTKIRRTIPYDGRYASRVTWRAFAEADPRAALDACRRLVEIERGDYQPADRERAIAEAVYKASLALHHWRIRDEKERGLTPSPSSALAPPAGRLRPLEPEFAPRRLGAVLAELRGWHLRDENDPAVQRMLRAMEGNPVPGGEGAC